MSYCPIELPTAENISVELDPTGSSIPASGVVSRVARPLRKNPLVLVPGSMLVSAESAIRWRQAVVHAVVNRLQCLQISEYRLKIIVAQVSVDHKRHE